MFFFDFVYMKKPVIFYQFDYKNFRKGQYGEGYFSYQKNPFGDRETRQEEIFNLIEKYIKKDFSVTNAYLQAHKEYFRLYDTNNCERIYRVVNYI